MTSNDPMIFSYTRAEAVADGMQMDVTKLAVEAGIRLPVFLTHSVYAQFVAVPEGVEAQDETGRLWDILNVLSIAISRSAAHTDRLDFSLYVRNGDSDMQLVNLIATCGPLDISDPRPAVTVMLPEDE